VQAASNTYNANAEAAAAARKDYKIRGDVNYLFSNSQ
jgi:hypothetical protein